MNSWKSELRLQIESHISLLNYLQEHSREILYHINLLNYLQEHSREILYRHQTS